MKLEYSSIAKALRGNDYRIKINEAREFCERNAIDFGVQIHNTTTLEEIERLYKEDVELTFHAPILGKCCINLATRNIGPSLKSLEDTLRIMERFNSNLVVFHGFYMVDEPIPVCTYGSTDIFNNIAIRKDLLYPSSNNHNFISKYFFDNEEYRFRFELLQDNLRRIDEMYQGFDICIENDFPSYCFGNILAKYISKLEHKICLDTGHLFAASVLHKKNFLSEAEKILLSNNVICSHFHSSLLKKDTIPDEIVDGHKNLSVASDIPLRELLSLMLKYDVNDFVFEIYEGNISDFQTFLEWKNNIDKN